MAFSLTVIPRAKTACTIAIFATGNTVAMLLGVVGSLVQARYIGPSDMGVFRTFGIVAGYLFFFELGVFSGLQREIPLQLGCGNRAQAEQAASACLAWIMFASLASGTIFLGLALRSACLGEWMQFWGWLAYAPGSAATLYGGYLSTTFRTGQQFIALSKASVIQAIAATLVLPLLPIMGYYGACLRAAVSSVTNISLLHRWRPLRVRPRLDWPGFWRVVRIGLPLSGIGYVYTSLWISLEGTLVLAWFGTKALGLYSVAVFVRTVVGQLVQNVSQVLNVKMCERYGRSNSARDALRRIVAPVALMSLASLPLIAVGWLLMPRVVRVLIPRYVEATFLMQVFLIMMPVLMLKIPTAVLWVAVKLLDCFTSVIVGFAAFMATAYCSFRMGFGLPGMAVAFLIGQVTYLLVAWAFTLKLVHQERGQVTRLDDKGVFGGADTL